MSLFKAVFLTLLISLIELGLQAISYAGLQMIGIDLLGSHVFGPTVIFSRIIAYSLVLYFFQKNLSALIVPESPGLRVKTIMFLTLLAIGLRLVESPFLDLYYNFTYEQVNTGIPVIYDWKYFYLIFLSLVIAPVLEELFFRKFLISRLLKKYGKTVSILISSTLFAAIHWETVESLFPAFIFGITAGFLFLKTKNIWHLIFLHFSYNLLGALINAHSSDYYIFLKWLDFNILYWSIFILGILVSVFSIKILATGRKPAN